MWHEKRGMFAFYGRVPMFEKRHCGIHELQIQRRTGQFFTSE
jgi:hypothetical protein